MDQNDFGNASCEANDMKQQESFDTTVNAESYFESPTPEKPNWGRKSSVVTSLAKNLLTENFKNEKECYGELSDDHKILVDLFNKMDTSIRLLRLGKKTTSLKNISAQVEVLASRKLSAKHIAQMKYVLPDAVQIKKILSHDEESSLMYPDIKITLIRRDFLDSSHANQNHSPSMALCKAFHASLLKFVSLHPKDTEIPESILPEPFNSSDINLNELSTVPSPQSPPTISSSSSSSSSLNASHLPSSFRKSTFQTLNKQSDTTDTKVASDVTKVSSPLPVIKISNFMASSSTPNRECSKLTDDAVMMMETPDQRTPQRPLHISGDKFANEKHDGSKVAVTKSARKLHFMAEPKHDRDILDGVAASFCLDDNEEHVSMKEASSSTGEKTMASLPSTFDVICLISRSNNRPLITKKELVHKILSKNLEIDETSEVEEHLATLEELYPEWICKKTVPNDGEIFYSVKHISDPKAVRARLVNAI